MGIASFIAEKIKGYNCGRLVCYTKQEVAFTGVGGEVGCYKINIGTFSNSVKVTNTVTEVMKALDNNQYLLCQQAHDSAASPAFRDKCLQARVMCTIGLSNFQALAALQEPGKPLNPEIKNWIRNMNALVLQCMESFLPTPNTPMYRLKSSKAIYRMKESKEIKREASKDALFEDFSSAETIRLQPSKRVSKKPTMSQIMKYQGIDEADLNKAVEILKQPSK